MNVKATPKKNRKAIDKSFILGENADEGWSPGLIGPPGVAAFSAAKALVHFGSSVLFDQSVVSFCCSN